MPDAISQGITPTIRPDVIVRPRTRRSPADALGTVQPIILSEEPVPVQAPALEPEPYKVGYKRPPKHTQFKKGQTGNKKGRPKGAKGLKTIVRDVFTQKVVVRGPSGTQRMSKMEAIIHKAAEKSFGGDLRAMLSAIKLYAQAVPDEELAPAVATDLPAEDLDEHDQAMLAEFLRKAAEAEDAS